MKHNDTEYDGARLSQIVRAHGMKNQYSHVGGVVYAFYYGSTNHPNNAGNEMIARCYGKDRNMQAESIADALNNAATLRTSNAELLAALELFVAVDDRDEYYHCDTIELAQAMKRARAVLAKCKGGAWECGVCGATPDSDPDLYRHNERGEHLTNNEQRAKRRGARK